MNLGPLNQSPWDSGLNGRQLPNLTTATVRVGEGRPNPTFAVVTPRPSTPQAQQ